MDWKQELLNQIRTPLKKDEQGIYYTGVDNSQSFAFHKEHSKGAHLRKLKDQKFHQIYWETPSYVKALEAFLPPDLSGKTILDFGCGDGRFTEYLLKKGATKIVCVDFDYNTLLSLNLFANENSLNESLLFIHSDYDNFPAFPDCFDIILSIGVLYYLNNKYEDAVYQFYINLKRHGLLITSDPDLEGFLMRGLIFDSLDEFIRIFKTRTFKETKEETPFRFRLFDEQESEKIFTNTGFSSVEKRVISSFHNLLRVLMLRGNIKAEELEKNENDIWKVLEYLDDNGKLAKHLIWRLEK